MDRLVFTTLIFSLKLEFTQYVIVKMFNLVLILGKNSFNRQSLHHTGSDPNPYEEAISIIGKTMAEFDDDNLIPCFGFGDGMYLINFK